MTEFDRVWEASRHNVWSFAYPAVIVCGLLALICIAFIRNSVHRRLMEVASVLLFTVIAILASCLEIEEKWRIRGEWVSAHSDAMTEEQSNAAIADGANRVLGPLLFGFRATAILVGLLLVIRRVSFVAETQSGHFRKSSETDQD